MYPVRELYKPRLRINWNWGMSAGGRNNATTYRVSRAFEPLKYPRAMGNATNRAVTTMITVAVNA